jgi:hypothetical protein
MVSAAATLAASIIGCRGSQPDGGSQDAHKVAELKSQAAALTKPLAQVRAAVPEPAQLAEAGCTDDELRLRLEGGYARALLADYDYLGWYHQAAGDPYQGPQERWQLLTARSLLAVAPPASIDNKKAAIDALFRLQGLRAEYQYLAVVRATQRELPRLEGERFHAGAFQGWLMVFEVAAAKRWCQARVSAHSSTEIVGTERQARERVIWLDFQRHLRRELHAALARITRRMNLVID